MSKNTFVCEEIKEDQSDFIGELWSRIKDKKLRAWSNDNVAEIFQSEEEKQRWINELSVRFEGMMEGLLIDYKNDPNAHGTPKRLAKMWANEIGAGRYTPSPEITVFPNEEGPEQYKGMLVIRTELRSLCSHHHAAVRGSCYVATLPGKALYGLSKAQRIVSWKSSRPTLQEALTGEIADEIQKATQTKHVGIYIQCNHNCLEMRGVQVNNSLTQTTVLRGDFLHDPSVKSEFMQYIALQQAHRRD